MNSQFIYTPFSEVFKWCQKSNIGSRQGKSDGKYKLYIASGKDFKYYDEYLEEGESLVFGTGGNPCIHYVTGRFAYTNHCEAAQKKRNDVCTKFYYYYFQKDSFAQLRSTFVGGGIKNSSKKKIGSLLVPVPPLPEQKRIVARIEELFSQLDAGVAELQAAKKRLKVYRQAVLKEAFEDIQNIVPFGEIMESRLGKMLDKQKNKGIPRKYLRNINVRWFSFDLSDLLKMRIDEDEIEKYSIHKGDLVICEGGEPGRCAVWMEDEPIFYQKALHRIRFTVLAEPKFYMYYLWFAAQTGQLQKYFTGTGIKHLTGQSLVKIPVPLTDIRTQREILSIIESRLSVCDSIEKTIDTALQQAEALRQSILKQAFEGKL
jgi:type I restriction enzyme, S subunit